MRAIGWAITIPEVATTTIPEGCNHNTEGMSSEAIFSRTVGGNQNTRGGYNHNTGPSDTNNAGVGDNHNTGCERRERVSSPLAVRPVSGSWLRAEARGRADPLVGTGGEVNVWLIQKYESLVASLAVSRDKK